MDSKIIHAACMGAAVTVIATRVAIIEQERNTIDIPRESRINAIAQQIRMKPIILYRLCDVLTSHDLL